MADSKEDNLVVATQFSRLRSREEESGDQPETDLAYEAASALSESMELLAAALKGVVDGEQWDKARHQRLRERVDALSSHVERCKDEARSSDKSAQSGQFDRRAWSYPDRK